MLPKNEPRESVGVIAVITIRTEPQYRRGAFEKGLQRAGYSLKTKAHPQGKEDFLVLWNYHPATIQDAANWEAAGGTVLVCENGYAGKDELGRQYYAIGVHGHNGAGWFPVGTEDRLTRLEIDVKPWRTDGKHMLVCGQRGIGSREMASPANWHTFVARDIAKRTNRPIKIRPHPGNFPGPTKLEDDLIDAWACCIWSSSAGIRALALGVPVFYSAPHWICEAAANHDLSMPDVPVYSDDSRLHAMRHMSWGQRSVAEIETGEVFATIRDNIESAVW